MAKKFIPLKKSDNPESVKAYARMTGGKIKKVEDTKTGKVMRAIVYDE